MDPRIRIRSKTSRIRNTARTKGWAKADLYGVLCLAFGELCWLGGPEEGAQVQARQLGHVSQLLCGPIDSHGNRWEKTFKDLFS